MSFQFDSSAFEKGLDEYSRKAQKALLAGMVAAADALIDDATDIVPFDRGFSGGLASSATKDDPKYSGSEAEVIVGFNKEYAARLHEDMTLNISQRRTSGQTRSQKYLEKPIKENGKKYARIMAKVIRSRLS